MPAERRTSNPAEMEWNKWGDQRWGYFSDEVKQRITYYLSTRVKGKNIDLGGGWYESHEGSTIVDLASVNLKNNKARDKVQYDLDELGKGRHLPFKDNSFDSATLISVWQYLKHPEAVTKELERIICPGGELFIINGQNAGINELMEGTGNTKKIKETFEEAGYDTLLENIPTPRSVDHFQSLAVGMPQPSVFGDRHSRVRNKESRIAYNEKITNNPSLFVHEYRRRELGIRMDKLGKLSSYPVTEYSQQYLAMAEELSDRVTNDTGVSPLIFSQFDTPIEYALLTPDSPQPLNTYIHLSRRERTVPLVGDLNVLNTYGHFPQQSVDELLKFAQNFKLQKGDRMKDIKGNEYQIYEIESFIAAYALTSYTKEVQKQLYDALRRGIPDLDARLQNQVALRYSLLTNEKDQKREIDTLIAQKKRIDEQGIPTIGRGQLDPYSLRLGLIYHMTRSE